MQTASGLRNIVLLVCIGALAACSGGPDTDTNDSPYHLIEHDQISYAWLFPGALTGAIREEGPNGWNVWSNNFPLESSVWIADLSSRLSRLNTISRKDIAGEADLWRLSIERSAELLSPSSRQEELSVTLEQSISGRDRMGAPVEVRVLSLKISTLDETHASVVANWAAQLMGGQSALVNRDSPAGVFQIAIAIVPLIDAFGEPARNENGTAQAAYAVWVAVPNRLPDADSFQKLAVDFAEVFPIATKFSAIAVTEQALELPKQTRSIAVIATFDRGSLLPEERDRVLDEFIQTLEKAGQTGAQLRVGLVRSCEESMIKAPGADDFISNSSPGFADEIRSRFAMIFADSSLLCLSNLSQRSAILAAQQSGDPWETADLRWFFWLTKRPDIVGVSLDNVLISAGMNEYSGALNAEDAHYYAVGAADDLCNDADKTTVPQEPTLAGNLKSAINNLAGTWIEYCSDWPTTLGNIWASEASVDLGLRLNGTPLPDTIQVFSRGASVPEESVFGYILDLSNGSIVPGDSNSFSSGDIWNVTYTTLMEPDISDF